MNNIYLKEISLESRGSNSYAYWKKLPFYKTLTAGQNIIFQAPVTFFVGENGSGKSTLIEAIAVSLGYNAEGGSKNFNFSTRNTTSDLFAELRIKKAAHEKDGYFLRAESFYNVASNIEELGINVAGYGGKSLHNQSHGESFLALVQNRLRGQGLYIFDEPEAALSPMRQLAMMIEISNLVKLNSQFIIATHSPILLSFPLAKIYNLDDGINEIKYEESAPYRLTKDFLNNPKAYLSKLL